MLPIPAYEYMVCLHLFRDHLQHSPRLWLPRTMICGGCTASLPIQTNSMHKTGCKTMFFVQVYSLFRPRRLCAHWHKWFIIQFIVYSFILTNSLLLLLFCRKMMDLENQNKELLATIARREEAMHQANVRTCVSVYLSVFVCVYVCVYIHLVVNSTEIIWLMVVVLIHICAHMYMSSVCVCVCVSVCVC